MNVQMHNGYISFQRASGYESLVTIFLRVDIIVPMNGVDFGVFLGPEDNKYETLKTRASSETSWGTTLSG